MKKKARSACGCSGVNLLISAFAFGGGYVVVPMIRKYFVTRRQCFTEDDLLRDGRRRPVRPGAIAMNLAALAGYRVAGVAGSVVSCLAGVLPPLLLLSLISLFYTAFCENVVIAAILRGMQAGVARADRGCRGGYVPGGPEGTLAAADDDGPSRLCSQFPVPRSRRPGPAGLLPALRRPGLVAEKEGDGRMMELWRLFLAFLQIGLFSIGGRLRGDSRHPAAGGGNLRMDQPAGVHRHSYHLPDDARAVGRQHLYALWGSALREFLGPLWPQLAVFCRGVTLSLLLYAFFSAAQRLALRGGGAAWAQGGFGPG